MEERRNPENIIKYKAITTGAGHPWNKKCWMLGKKHDEKSAQFSVVHFLRQDSRVDEVFA